MKAKQYDLEERLLDYAAAIIRLIEELPKTRAGNHVAGQLLRSGTSPLPNHGEAQAAESPNDFVHKLRVCLKELRESFRWLRLIHRVTYKIGISTHFDAEGNRRVDSDLRCKHSHIRKQKQTSLTD